MGEGGYYYPYAGRDRLIHIVDSDVATCEALSVLFRLEGFHTVFSTDAENFAVNLERRRPDALIINLHVGNDSGLTLLRRVRAQYADTPVFMLGEHLQVGEAVNAMKMGATDVVGKPIDTEYLLTAVRDALQLDAIGGSNGRHGLEIRGFAQLTPREREVLQLISSGQSNKEAGRELGISPRTVEVHRARVMEKLGAKNTADLMRIVLAK